MHDATGRLVNVLAGGALAAGEHRLSWTGTDGAGRPLPAGIYFAKLETTAGTRSLKITLAR
jgi:flagellar hook assembly protein FlgD